MQGGIGWECRGRERERREGNGGGKEEREVCMEKVQGSVQLRLNEVTASY